MKLLRPAGHEHADHVAVLGRGGVEDLAEAVVLAELAIGVGEDAVDLADLGLGIEAEVARVGDAGQLAPLLAEELLFDLGLPAQRLEDADWPLRFEHALAEASEDLLVGAPRAAAGRRRRGRRRRGGDRLVAQRKGLERSRGAARRAGGGPLRSRSCRSPR